MARNYADLKDRIDSLALSLLSFPRRTAGDYTQKEVDQTKAFILLAHAEIESFIEEIAIEAASEAEDRWMRMSKQSPILSRLVSHWFALKNREFELLSDDIVSSAIKSYKNELTLTNHGVKIKNLLEILLPLGFEFVHFDATVLLSFNTFGQDRGLVAHKSFKAKSEINPDEEENRVKEVLLPEVSKIYQTLQNLRIIPR